MNVACINGRLTMEPEIKQLENNQSYCIFFIANDVYFGNNKTTGFFKAIAWGKMGKIIHEHCITGTEIFITGRLEQYHYKDKNDVNHYEVQIVVENFNFGSRSEKSDKE